MNRFLCVIASWMFVLGLGEAGAQQGAPMVITITKTDCSRLIQHQPAADVAYKPGVDVRGRPVVSADADPAAAALAKKLVPEVLEFPVNINPIGYGARKSAYSSKATTEAAISSGGGTATAAQNQALATAESNLAKLSAKGYDNTTASVGTVKFDLARNTATFNGEPLTSDDQAKLAAACSKQGVR